MDFLESVGVGFTSIEIQEALDILSDLDEKSVSNDTYYCDTIANYEFNAQSKIGEIRKTIFDNCLFMETPFNGTAGSNSYFQDCTFYDCKINNAGLKFASFVNSKFLPQRNICTIEHTGFDHTVFDGTRLEKCKIRGCSFADATIFNCIMDSIDIEFCNFESSIFDNVSIINMDLSKTGLNYVEFNKVYVENVILPFTDILHSFGGLELISKWSNQIHLKFSDSSKSITADDYINQLSLIQPYFYHKKDYFAVANISIFLGKQQDAYYYIIEGLKSSLNKKDFQLIKNLCKLASSNCFFTRKQLQEFYDLLLSPKIASHLNTFEFKHYLIELDEMKRLLIDNPFGMPQMTILLHTSIPSDDYEQLSKLLKSVDNLLERQLPQTFKYVSIRHNSPNIIELFLSDALPDLLLFFGYISGFLFGTTKFITTLQNIKKKSIEIKGAELDNLIKEKQLKKLEAEMSSQNTDKFGIMNTDSIDIISYHVKTNIRMPIDLRANSYMK